MSEGRRLRAAKVVLWVHDRIVKTVPKGIGTWSPAWHLVASDDAAFVESLQAWIETGSKSDMDKAKKAADALVGAWKRAGEAWLTQ